MIINSKAHGALKQYGRASTQTEVFEATPHRLIQMLMEGALAKIAAAKGHMLRGNVAEKGELIGGAISIVDGLKTCLDKKAGGEVAANLEQLYNYMTQRLLEANLQQQPDYLDEVGDLLREIKGGWDAIPEDIRNAHAERSKLNSVETG